MVEEKKEIIIINEIFHLCNIILIFLSRKLRDFYQWQIKKKLYHTKLKIYHYSGQLWVILVYFLVQSAEQKKKKNCSRYVVQIAICHSWSSVIDLLYNVLSIKFIPYLDYVWKISDVNDKFFSICFSFFYNLIYAETLNVHNFNWDALFAQFLAFYILAASLFFAATWGICDKLIEFN